jgi:hypothetical protein
MEISKIWQWFANPPTDAPTATILLRLMAGGVFLWEGILKFVYPNQGVGRFTKLGMSFSGIDGKLCRHAGNRRRNSFNRRISDEIYRLHIYY